MDWCDVLASVGQCPDAGSDNVASIWFGDEFAASVEFADVFGKPRYARGEEDEHTGSMFVNPFRKTDPIHEAGHQYVSEDKIDVGVAVLDDIERFGGLPASVTKYPQSLRCSAIPKRIKTSSSTTRMVKMPGLKARGTRVVPGM